MAEKKITQTELANQIGISRTALNLYATGKNTPSVTTAKNIADALECTLDDLFNENTMTSTKCKGNSENHINYKRIEIELSSLKSLYVILNKRGKEQFRQSAENIASNSKNIEYGKINAAKKYVSELGLS